MECPACSESTSVTYLWDIDDDDNLEERYVCDSCELPLQQELIDEQSEIREREDADPCPICRQRAQILGFAVTSNNARIDTCGICWRLYLKVAPDENYPIWVDCPMCGERAHVWSSEATDTYPVCVHCGACGMEVPDDQFQQQVALLEDRWGTEVDIHVDQLVDDFGTADYAIGQVLKTAVMALRAFIGAEENEAVKRWRQVFGEGDRYALFRREVELLAAYRQRYGEIELDEDEPEGVADLRTAFEEAMRELDAMIGLAPVKAQVRALANHAHMNAIRIQKGMPGARMSLHMIFEGNPGTGKTEVARKIGQIYRALGLLQNGNLTEVSREDLVAQFVGHTAQKVKDVVDAAMGGVLFIDEAYTLVSQSGSAGADFGREAVDALLKLMEDRRDRFVVIAAGYPSSMAAFINSNPGLRRRFPTTIRFDDYSPAELVEITKHFAQGEGFELSSGTPEKFRKLYTPSHADNAGEARNRFEQTKVRMATRVMRQHRNPSEDVLRRILPEDVPDV